MLIAMFKKLKRFFRDRLSILYHKNFSYFNLDIVSDTYLIKNLSILISSTHINNNKNQYQSF